MGNCFSHGSQQISPKKLGEDTEFSPAEPKESVTSDLKNTTSLPLSPKDVVESFRQASGYEHIENFTYEEMQLTTKNFRPDLILGEGGFGIVYKGVIDEYVRPGYVSTQVAVKDLNPDGLQGDREWLAEVNYLGQLSHPNLVKLIGYCCEDEHRILVYDYMAYGSLEKHLFGRMCISLPWRTRVKIALDAAKGLAFLHGAETPIIYRDFKASNILLDKDFNAKLSDFGLAKEGPKGDQTHVSTRIMGTYGYAAPEYLMTGHLTARSDVYSFGVVLLEMLIGRRAIDKSKPSREYNLVDWAYPLLNHNRRLLRILDPRMEGQFTPKMAQKIAHLAYQCLSHNPRGRPTMNQVVEILESLHSHLNTMDTVPNLTGTVTLLEVPETVHSMERKQKLKRDVKDRVYIDSCRRRTSKERHRSQSDIYGNFPQVIGSTVKSSSAIDDENNMDKVMSVP